MASRSTVIKNARIFDGEKFISGDILLAKGKIAGIGEYSASDAFDCDYIFDVGGAVVTAGLVDIHTHLWSVSPDVFGTSAEGTGFPNGVTACVDGGAVKGDKTLLDSMQMNTAVFVCTKVEDDRVYFEKTNELLEAYGDRAVGVKLYFDTTGGQAHSIEPLRQICAFARERGLKVMVHCSHSPVPMYDIVDTLSEGDILTHIYHSGESGCEENDYAALRLAREKGVVLDVGMAGHVHTDFRVLERAVECGQLPDTVSTDVTNLSAYSRGGNYGLCLCMSILRNAGVSEETVLRMVGENAARAVGRESEWGKLAVGRRADIAVLEWTDESYAFLQDENNTLRGEHSYKCMMTVCDGRVVWRR